MKKLLAGGINVGSGFCSPRCSPLKQKADLRDQDGRLGGFAQPSLPCRPHFLPSLEALLAVFVVAGLSIPQLLESILKLLPLDTYEPNSVMVMDLVDSDKAKGLQIPDVWQTYRNLLFQTGFRDDLGKIERFAFYERAKKAFAVVATGETALYGNIILRKGVIAPQEQH
ncbi:fucose mutarotase [Gracilinanus agilis]|uniref:fucose mutarotase n=1 Tax=Gracilinanus agilis TaxID=191870 RepID=UPI001CFE9CB9|nr:fucose mutarotase [Gracilinanus agilis]